MHIRNGICYKFSVSDVVLIILILILDGRDWARFNKENLKSAIQRLKLNPRYDLFLQDFHFENCGLVVLSNPVESTLFDLSASGELRTKNYYQEEYTIEINKDKERALFSKFSKNEKKILREMAKKTEIIMKRG